MDYKINTVDSLAYGNLLDGPIQLSWTDEYLETPVLRIVTADGLQDVPLDAVTMWECSRTIFTTAEYEKAKSTIFERV